MLYTNDHKGVFLKDPASGIHGKQGDNASKATKIHNHKDKALGRPPSTQPLPQSHGTTSLSPWTLIGLEHQEGTGADEGGGSQGGMSPEQMM